MSFRSEDRDEELAKDFVDACKAMGGTLLGHSNNIMCEVLSKDTFATDILFSPSERSLRMIRKDKNKEVIENISLDGIERINSTYPYLGISAESQNKSVITIYRDSLTFFAEGTRY